MSIDADLLENAADESFRVLRRHAVASLVIDQSRCRSRTCRARVVPHRARAVGRVQRHRARGTEAAARDARRVHWSVAAVRLRPHAVRSLTPVFCPDCGTWNRARAVRCMRCNGELPEIERRAARATRRGAFGAASPNGQPVSRDPATRQRRHGERLLRRAPTARASARDQGAALAPRARRGNARALPSRGRGGEPARAPAHLHDHRLRRGGRSGVHRDAVSRWRLAGGRAREGANGRRRSSRRGLRADRDRRSTTRTGAVSCIAT